MINFSLYLHNLYIYIYIYISVNNLIYQYSDIIDYYIIII